PFATLIALQGGKIVMVSSSNDNYTLTRYTADGALDSSFGVNGIGTGSEGTANAIALQGDKIVVAGSKDLARYTANGALDPTFGISGTAERSFGLSSIAMQGDKIVVGGYTFYSDDNFTIDFALARYTEDG